MIFFQSTCPNPTKRRSMLCAPAAGNAKRGRTDLARQCNMLQASVSFLESQVYMLRLPAWRQVLAEINCTAMRGPAPRCACSKCQAVGVAWTGAKMDASECQACTRVLSVHELQNDFPGVEEISVPVVPEEKADGERECELQPYMRSLLAELRVGIGVCERPVVCRSVDAGSLRLPRSDVYIGMDAVVARSDNGKIVFFDESGVCSGWGEPVMHMLDERMLEMDRLITHCERLRAKRIKDALRQAAQPTQGS